MDKIKYLTFKEFPLFSPRRVCSFAMFMDLRLISGGGWGFFIFSYFTIIKVYKNIVVIFPSSGTL